MAAKRKRARRFVVGYKGMRDTTVWGQRHWLANGDPDCRMDDFCKQMTEKDARKAVTQMASGATVYELVERS